MTLWLQKKGCLNEVFLTCITLSSSYVDRLRNVSLSLQYRIAKTAKFLAMKLHFVNIWDYMISVSLKLRVSRRKTLFSWKKICRHINKCGVLFCFTSVTQINKKSISFHFKVSVNHRWYIVYWYRSKSERSALMAGGQISITLTGQCLVYTNIDLHLVCFINRFSNDRWATRVWFVR